MSSFIIQNIIYGYSIINDRRLGYVYYAHDYRIILRSYIQTELIFTLNLSMVLHWLVSQLPLTKLHAATKYPTVTHNNK